MSMFTVRVLLQDLTVHPELLYDGNQRLSKFTYVQRLLTLNKSAVLMLHNLEQFVLDAKAEHLDMFGSSKDALKAALQTIQRMLSAPVWTSQAGEDPRLLEMLQAKKKRFSTGSGCWLKVCWTTNTISVYGINRAAAVECIDRMREQLKEKRAQEKVQEEQQTSVAETDADAVGMMQLKDYVLQTTGCQVSMERDTNGKIVIQLAGSNNECQGAQHVLTQILNLANGRGGDSIVKVADPVASASSSASPIQPPMAPPSPSQRAANAFSPPPSRSSSALSLPEPSSVKPQQSTMSASCEVLPTPAVKPSKVPPPLQIHLPMSSDRRSQASQQCHSPGYDSCTTPSTCMSDVLSQDDPVMDVATKVLTESSNVDWICDLLRQMAEFRVDPLQVVELLQVQRDLQSLF
eukprot:CAMPEP_0174298928 /NCGR_PEP_ID=MMETSP0809-20121228/55187_1 /TAXON_ID=73025 ORGANISM="Eutreptiella gymnastica-like, Strain CCMP1594" /NCGR_SAMPLE_ID=MMETSP0809 /ASSEMBLY_ACC=CAM_ASM_000658 /LENGTH=404 /DNA_ID=CAMNT_0015403735 /DNA_START=30 /DNA_END=1244 /DNA_ORIENTATION=+